MKETTHRPSPNRPLPKMGKSDDKLRKKAAFATLSVEEFGHSKDNGSTLLSSDDAVAEARDWVNYDEL